eukprot:IDg5770t1
MRNAADDCGKEFKFLAAWHVLKEHPRFSPFHDAETQDSQTGKPPYADSASPREDEGEKEAGKERIAQEKLKVANEALDAQRERTAAINKHYEILLFTSGPQSSDGEEVAEYFRTMRKRVVCDLRNSEKKRQKHSRQPSPLHADIIDATGTSDCISTPSLGQLSPGGTTNAP